MGGGIAGELTELDLAEAVGVEVSTDAPQGLVGVDVRWQARVQLSGRPVGQDGLDALPGVAAPGAIDVEGDTVEVAQNSVTAPEVVDPGVDPEDVPELRLVPAFQDAVEEALLFLGRGLLTAASLTQAAERTVAERRQARCRISMTSGPGGFAVDGKALRSYPEPGVPVVQSNAVGSSGDLRGTGEEGLSINEAQGSTTPNQPPEGDSNPSPVRRRLPLRRIAPWAVAGMILAYLFYRIDLSELGGALARGPYLWLAAYVLLQLVVALLADSYATHRAVEIAGIQLSFRRLFELRAAAYLLGLITYTLGQGGLGYLLHRGGERLPRVSGALFFVVVVNGGVLTAVAVAGLLLALPDAMAVPKAALSICLAGLLLYLGLIHWRRPRSLALEPLFRAGVVGHLRAAAARLPHVLLMVFLNWGAFRLWGIPLPFGTGVSLMPLVLFVAALPITPAGLGTSQALQVLLFSTFAGEGEDGAAVVLAFSLAHGVWALALQAVIGAAFALRLSRRKETAPDSLAEEPVGS